MKDQKLTKPLTKFGNFVQTLESC